MTTVSYIYQLECEIRRLKETALNQAESIGEHIEKRIEAEQKLEKIKEIHFKSQCECCNSIVVRRWDRFPELKEILDSQEKE